jgi:mono/diheme cytochrome c family protein
MLRNVAVAVTALFLLAVLGLVVAEFTWTTPARTTPRDSFLYGSTGTELIPLPVFLVLPDLFPDHFQPSGKGAGDWVDQFGFVRGKPDVNYGLPLGFSVSSYRPKSGAPSPVQFVGFNCAVCHTSYIRRSDTDPGPVVYGMGNASLDLVAFGDAIKSSLFDEKRLTLDKIEQAYQQKEHRALGPVDKAMVAFWLTGVRKALKADLPLRDLPRGGGDLRDSTYMTSGPGRNQPMKETVRFLIGRTPFPDGGSSEIPSLYFQSHRRWAQADGSLGDPSTRNSLAALGVGASVQNLRVPGILQTLHATSEFVSSLEGPKYADVFGSTAPIDAARAARGREVYMSACGDCHGWPGRSSADWVRGKRQGEVVSYQEVGTDPARVTFRYYEKMAQLIYDFFPAGHPLRPKRSELRPNAGDIHGYINSPLESVFTRAPYLHNGSVATLAELINLVPRRAVLYRGANVYDPVGVGLAIPDHPDTKRYFRFDTQAYGNSNRGHDYPWPYRGAGWDEQKLKDLLEYLKTI